MALTQYALEHSTIQCAQWQKWIKTHEGFFSPISTKSLSQFGLPKRVFTPGSVVIASSSLSMFIATFSIMSLSLLNRVKWGLTSRYWLHSNSFNWVIGGRVRMLYGQVVFLQTAHLFYSEILFYSDIQDGTRWAFCSIGTCTIHTRSIHGRQTDWHPSGSSIL